MADQGNSRLQELARIEELRKRRFRKELIRRRTTRLKRLERFAEVEEVKERYRKVLSDNISYVHNEYIPLEVPDVLSLRQNYDATCNLLESIRDLVLIRGLPVFLYFDNVKHIQPGAALALTSEVFRARNLRPGRGHRFPLTGNFPQDERARRTLVEMGFFRLLHIEAPAVDWSAHDGETFHLGFMTLTQADPELIREFHHDLLEEVVLLEAGARRKLQGALIEAVSNTIEHAYSVPPPYAFMSRRSWLGGYVNPAKREFLLMVLDHGAGIPATLDATLIERFIRLSRFKAPTPQDCELIQYASELRRTSTLQPGRGKGFENMKSFVRACDDGELRVNSRCGQYIFKSDGSEVGSELSKSLGGTMIQWRIRHSSAPLKLPSDLER